jgi:hypothetical protein
VVAGGVAQHFQRRFQRPRACAAEPRTDGLQRRAALRF